MFDKEIPNRFLQSTEWVDGTDLESEDNKFSIFLLRGVGREDGIEGGFVGERGTLVLMGCRVAPRKEILVSLVFNRCRTCWMILGALQMPLTTGTSRQTGWR